MYYHYVVIGSSYEKGTRLGYHESQSTPIDSDLIKKTLSKIRKETGRSDFGIHMIITDSPTWESVIEKDSFFKDVIRVNDMGDFISITSTDGKVTAKDIAKFFVSYKGITQLKLQKLIYLAYANYLEKTNKKLFSEKIVAYKYGPVIEEIYQEYKQHKREPIEEDEKTYVLEDVEFPQVLVRLSLADDGPRVLEMLIDTLKEYGDKTASELVQITHVKDGPWDSVYVPRRNCIISDELILEKHIHEKDKVAKL